MTHVFQKYYLQVISLVLISCFSAEVLAQNHRKTIRIHSLANFPFSTNDSIYEITPVYKKYAYDTTQEIAYTSKHVATKDMLENFSVGTYLFSLSKPNHLPETKLPLHIIHDEIYQIVYTKNTGYLGHLEELLNIPFVLSPEFLSEYGHQTDLRVATDCAELAIYGKRKQGMKVPYCGLRGITKYMQKTSVIKKGIILHFGHQVSVLYEDRGIPNVIDGDDLLIHAYKLKAEIIPLKETNLHNTPYITYQWKQ
ncbi:hypothetical protein [uncultured Kordia sp.]|uniref:hypothetical protein n=1 Tax=uncultured Kordia sp. TaxID=507699 RepID=UPI00260B5355|nr:hypothetical protein [uncultured Kordia sp.]